MVLSHGEVIEILSHFERQEAAQKTVLKQVVQSPRKFYITSLLVMLWCIAGLGFASMLVFPLPDIIAWLKHHPTTNILYTLQVPVVFIIAGVLGSRLGTITIGLYLTLGLLGIPFFAGGGGWQYLSHATFGYLIGFLLVPLAIDSVLNKAFGNTKWLSSHFVWFIIAALLGVMTVHMSGIMGMAVLCIMGKLPWAEWPHWVSQLSVHVVLYDFAIGLVALTLVRWLRMLFWVCLY